jgi:three-Cys-motif partner protein
MPKPQEILWRSEPRVLIKHQVYRHYLQCWMGKICRVFPVSTVVDAFAGPGEYEDGPDGSPIVIAKTLLEHSSNDSFNQLRLVCLEKNPDRLKHLIGRMALLPPSPRLKFIPVDPGEAATSFDRLERIAHAGPSDAPTLWILDPFDLAGVPFDLVRSCLRSRRDEVLVTWFADEIYRFCEDRTKWNAMDRHFGGQHWRSALKKTGESERKLALLAAYLESLRRLPEVRVNSVSISSKNETARYSLVFATHSDYGLQCFNPVGWRLDPVQGKMISEKRGMEQGDLFATMPVVDKLQSYLTDLAGTAVSFDRLKAEAGRLGYMDKHLRAALDVLAQDGTAVREYPLKARSKWPDDSVVRFYSAGGSDESGGDRFRGRRNSA